MRILAVDDDPVVRDLLKISLSRAGYFDAVFAESGAAALAMMAATERPFDCFLLDVSMPKMDGIELCRRIRALPRYAETPVIMITRLDKSKYITKAFDAGATDYIVKPFEQAEIGIRVDLARRRMTSQAAPAAPAGTAPAKDLPAALSDAFTLRKVPGAVSYEDMEKTLLGLPSFSRFRICVLKIVNIEELHAECPLPVFRQNVQTVAQILAELLWDEDMQMTYMGGGAIAFVLRGPSAVDCQALAVTLNDWLADAMSPDGIEPVVAVASDGPARYIPKLDRIACLTFARELADDLASEIILNAGMRARHVLPRVASN
ncbi:Response regulator receiver domain-containing protein [Roseivivax lentus]|uniref:Response regulator receiver domain-containing protein n=1 Tax=Roseivivax lentus TaxID=633194 RepID=A0A1N7N8E0_9RHOB|nr:response regulator [Roseivivax lentus]SIS94610.1 Response regulator receiver domain-containing protein [Roseivivax lentus]